MSSFKHIEPHQLIMCEKETLVSMVNELREEKSELARKYVDKLEDHMKLKDKNKKLIKQLSLQEKFSDKEEERQISYFTAIIDYLTGDYKKASKVVKGIREHFTKEFIEGNMIVFQQHGLFDPV